MCLLSLCLLFRDGILGGLQQKQVSDFDYTPLAALRATE
jgi:hypothetical protein